MKGEGIVIKALDSPWQVGHRSRNWLKLKPDYARSLDVDALIIGASYGQGRRAATEGLLSEYLLALGVTPRSGGEITHFVSFAKCVTSHWCNGSPKSSMLHWWCGALQPSEIGVYARLPLSCHLPCTWHAFIFIDLQHQELMMQGCNWPE